MEGLWLIMTSSLNLDRRPALVPADLQLLMEVLQIRKAIGSNSGV